MGEEVFKAVKITNVYWLGHIGPTIAKFLERASVPTITYETLYTYFATTVQHGGDDSEFWVVFEGESMALVLPEVNAGAIGVGYGHRI